MPLTGRDSGLDMGEEEATGDGTQAGPGFLGLVAGQETGPGSIPSPMALEEELTCSL